MGSGASAAICDEQQQQQQQKQLKQQQQQQKQNNDTNEKKVYFPHKTRSELFNISENYLCYRDFIDLCGKFDCFDKNIMIICENIVIYKDDREKVYELIKDSYSYTNLKYLRYHHHYHHYHHHHYHHHHHHHHHHH